MSHYYSIPPTDHEWKQLKLCSACLFTWLFFPSGNREKKYRLSYWSDESVDTFVYADHKVCKIIILSILLYYIRIIIILSCDNITFCSKQPFFLFMTSRGTRCYTWERKIVWEYYMCKCNAFKCMDPKWRKWSGARMVLYITIHTYAKFELSKYNDTPLKA